MVTTYGQKVFRKIQIGLEAAAIWLPGTVYAENAWCEPTTPNDFVYKCATGGTSHTAEPTWGVVVGGTTTDGATVVWTCYAKHGQAVAATARLLGSLTMKEPRKLYLPEEDTGALSKVVRTGVISVGPVEMVFDSDANFEQVLYFLLMGLKGAVEPNSITANGAKYLNDTVYTDLADALDDNVATEEEIAAFVAAEDKILVRMTASTALFRAVKFTMGTTKNQVATVVSVRCSDGDSDWLAATLIKDGTSVGGKSLAKTGIIEFTPPAGWGSDTIDEDAGYWVEFSWTVDWTALVDIAEIDTVPLASVWAFAPSLLSDPNQDSFTIEHGDNVQAFESEYVMCSALELSGAVEEPLKLRAELFGRKMTPTGFTSGINLLSVETIMASNTKLYVDDTWAGIGTTELAATLISFRWRLPTGIALEKMGDGTLHFTRHFQQQRQVELEMTWRFHTNSYAERAKWADQSKRAVRLEILGSVIKAGDPEPNKALRLDLWGIYSDWETLTDRDGADTVVVRMLSIGAPSSGDDYEFAMAVVNTLIFLP